MRVQHIAAFSQGGAAVAARRLHLSLLSLGAHSQLYFGDLQAAESRTIAPLPCKPLKAWQFGRQVRRLAGYLRLKQLKRRYLKGQPGYFSLPWRTDRPRLEVPFDQTDIVHLHWVARQIDLPSLFQSIPPDLPVVWTFHDMNPFTGGCHHSDACEAYQHGCGTCPLLRDPHPRDLSRLAFEAKMQAMEHHQIHVVTPSRWLEQVVRSSAMQSHFASIQTIANGIETAQFSRCEPNIARQKLGLPEDVLVLGYGAESLTNKRKGIDEFLQAVQRVGQTRRVIGLLFGKGAENIRSPDVELMPLGFLSTPNLLSEAYSAMDIFVSPTYAEILGQSILESLACETPVVAFDVGGVAESVVHQETGMLVRFGDVDSLVQSTLWLADHPVERRTLGRNGRSRTKELFDIAPVTEKQLQLYQTLSHTRSKNFPAKPLSTWTDPIRD